MRIVVTPESPLPGNTPIVLLDHTRISEGQWNGFRLKINKIVEEWKANNQSFLQLVCLGSMVFFGSVFGLIWGTVFRML